MTKTPEILPENPAELPEEQVELVTEIDTAFSEARKKLSALSAEIKPEEQTLEGVLPTEIIEIARRQSRDGNDISLEQIAKVTQQMDYESLESAA